MPVDVKITSGQTVLAEVRRCGTPSCRVYLFISVNYSPCPACNVLGAP